MRELRREPQLGAPGWQGAALIRVAPLVVVTCQLQVGWSSAAHQFRAYAARITRPLCLRFWNRSEVWRRNAVFCCCLVRRSDPKERRLGKRPSEEHDPEWKFCRNGPHQARTTTSRGIADSIKHVSGEPHWDGQCRK